MSQAVAAAREEPQPLHVTAETPGVTVYAKLPSEKRYSSQCTAPCSIELMPGAYELAAGRAGHSFAASQELFYVGQPSNLDVRLNEGSLLRGWGVAAMLGGLLLGGVLIATAPGSRTVVEGDMVYKEAYVDAPRAMLGGAVVATGTAVGLTLMLKQDQVSFDLTPATSAR